MKELMNAIAIWLTREKPPKPQPTTAEHVAHIVAYIAMTIILITMAEYFFVLQVCR